MSKIQELFNKIEENKKKSQDIKKMYKDALNSNQEHVELEEKIKALKDKKRIVENKIKQDFSTELDKLESIRVDIESDKQLLSDLAINQIAKGEMIEVTDKYENKYEPIFNVKLKKV